MEGHGRRQQPRHGSVHPPDGLSREPVGGVVAVSGGALVRLPHLHGLFVGTLQAHEGGQVDHAKMAGLKAGQGGEEGLCGCVHHQARSDHALQQQQQ